MKSLRRISDALTSHRSPPQHLTTLIKRPSLVGTGWWIYNPRDLNSQGEFLAVVPGDRTQVREARDDKEEGRYGAAMNNDPEALARDLLQQDDGTGAPTIKLEPVTTGMSGAAVFRATQQGHAPRYMKVGFDAAAGDMREEIARTQWLAGRGIAVPSVLRVEDRGDSVAVLMAALAGVPADISRLATPRLIAALAQAVKALHALPAADCPFDETLDARLARAQAAVDAGAIDPAEFEPHNRNTAPAEMLRRLRAVPPHEDVVVLHGDLTLGNIIVDESGACGFIDCGNAGRGDRYTDLALLHADIVAHRGPRAGAGFLAACGVKHWDAAKAQYFLDLYELF